MVVVSEGGQRNECFRCVGEPSAVDSSTVDGKLCLRNACSACGWGDHSWAGNTSASLSHGG